MQHGTKESFFEYELSRWEDFMEVNDDLRQAAKVDGVDLHRNTCDRKPVSQYPMVSAYINYIHEKYPYIRYDYCKDEFVDSLQYPAASE